MNKSRNSCSTFGTLRCYCLVGCGAGAAESDPLVVPAAPRAFEGSAISLAALNGWSGILWYWIFFVMNSYSISALGTGQ